MTVKRVPSSFLLRIIFEAYKDDPEGLLSDLEIHVDREESLEQFAQDAINCLEMDEEDQEPIIEYNEGLKKVPSIAELARKHGLKKAPSMV
tara:strand:+ start:11151 stop:11423 length:273 start_codon:yes stop_codon:yes gene_type:complete